MQKIVINCDYGGFGLSERAMTRYAELTDQTSIDDWDIPRSEPALVQVVTELGEQAMGRYSCLKIVEVPDDVEWQIEEYDGKEWVAEKHRIWQ